METNQYVNKIYEFVGQDGLIICGKANEFCGVPKLSKNNFVILYDVAVIRKNPLIAPQSVPNFLCVAYYYQAEYLIKNAGPMGIKYIKSEFQSKGNNILTKERLYFLFNVIEFTHKFHGLDMNALRFIMDYLNKYKDSTFSLRDYILSQYYTAVLYYELKEYQNSENTANSAIAYLFDALEGNDQQSMNVYKYLNTNLSLLILMDKKESPDKNMIEYETMAKEKFEEVFNINASAALKVGFILFDIYFSQGKLSECLDVYSRMKTILSTSVLGEKKISNGYFFYLALWARKAYVYIFLRNKKHILKAVNHIENDLSLFDSNNPDEKMFKISCELFCCLCRFIADKNTLKQNKLNSVLNLFRTEYEKNGKNLGFESLGMTELCINMIDICPNSNLVNTGKKLLEDKINLVLRQPDHLTIREILSFVFGVYNKISGLSKNLISDSSAIKQREYKEKIAKYTKMLTNEVLVLYNNFPILKSEYVQTAVIKSLQVYLSTLLKDRNFSAFKNEINDFETSEYGKEIIVKNNSSAVKLPCFGILLRLKGDEQHAHKNYSEALKYYLEAEKMFNSDDNIEKATNLMNIGLCFLLVGNKSKGAYYLKNSFNLFSELTQKEIDLGNQGEAQKLSGVVNKIQNILSRI